MQRTVQWQLAVFSRGYVHVLYQKWILISRNGIDNLISKIRFRDIKIGFYIKNGFFISRNGFLVSRNIWNICSSAYEAPFKYLFFIFMLRLSALFRNISRFGLCKLMIQYDYVKMILDYIDGDVA